MALYWECWKGCWCSTFVFCGWLSCPKAGFSRVWTSSKGQKRKTFVPHLNSTISALPQLQVFKSTNLSSSSCKLLLHCCGAEVVVNVKGLPYGPRYAFLQATVVADLAAIQADPSLSIVDLFRGWEESNHGTYFYLFQNNCIISVICSHCLLKRNHISCTTEIPELCFLFPYRISGIPCCTESVRITSCISKTKSFKGVWALCLLVIVLKANRAPI